MVEILFGNGEVVGCKTLTAIADSMLHRLESYSASTRPPVPMSQRARIWQDSCDWSRKQQVVEGRGQVWIPSRELLQQLPCRTWCTVGATVSSSLLPALWFLFSWHTLLSVPLGTPCRHCAAIFYGQRSTDIARELLAVTPNEKKMPYYALEHTEYSRDQQWTAAEAIVTLQYTWWGRSWPARSFVRL